MSALKKGSPGFPQETADDLSALRLCRRCNMFCSYKRARQEGDASISIYCTNPGKLPVNSSDSDKELWTNNDLPARKAGSSVIMQNKKIKALEQPLGALFSSNIEFVIPLYQRQYAWTANEAAVLFDDLYDFYHDEGESEQYFLGTIVLIKEEGNPQAYVIDGQQRLTTLTILLAVLASRTNADNKERITALLLRQPDGSNNLLPRPRIKLRDKDQPFFRHYIQDLRLEELLSLDESNLGNKAQWRILENTRIFSKKAAKVFDNETQLMDFVDFMLQRCFIVEVSTPSQESAYRVFSVMNSRGLILLPTDIIKAGVLGEIEKHNKHEVASYTEKWENLEERATSESFNDLFGHIRTMFSGTEAKRGLREELEEHILKKMGDPRRFIDEIVAPCEDAYLIIRDKNYTKGLEAEHISRILDWLSKIDNADWYPAAIRFLSIHGDDPAYVKWFFDQQMRMAVFMRTTGKESNERIERYARIIAELNENTASSLSDPISSASLTKFEKAELTQIFASNGKASFYDLAF